MQKQGKIWGQTSFMIGTDNFAVHTVKAKANSQCSKHKHVHRKNLFLVMEGRLRIRVWKNDYDLMDTVVLEKDDWTVVNAGEFHLFESIDDCEFLEIYYLDPVSNSDIVRENVGKGKDDIEQEQIAQL